jgi:integrase
MAYIEFREGRPKPYKVRLRTPGNKLVSKAFRRKTDADRWAVDQESSKHSGDWLDPALRRQPLSDFAEAWLATVVDRKPSTLAGYESILRRRVLPAFGTKPIGSIDKPMVRSFVADLSSSGLGAGTVKNALNVLKPILGTAVEAGALRINPAAGVAPPRSESQEMNFLTADEVEQLAEAIPSPYPVLIRVAAYSGLRAGELAALRVRDIDTMRGRIHVRQSVAEVHGECIFGTTKTHQSRTVPLPRTLMGHLIEHIAPVATDRNALVFTAKDGTVHRQSNFYGRTFKPAVNSAGLPDKLRFHDLRHTAAALMIELGAHPRAMMERLGHSSVTVTLDTYGHLFPSLEASLTDALEERITAALSNSPFPPRPIRAPESITQLQREVK